MSGQSDKEKMEEALKEAKDVWERSGLPKIDYVHGSHDETGKVALAIIAVELFKKK